MKKRFLSSLLFFLYTCSYASECEIPSAGILDELANLNSKKTLNRPGSLLNQVLANHEPPQVPKLEELEKKLHELKSDNNSDPVEIHELLKRIEREKRIASKEQLKQVLDENPNLLEESIAKTNLKPSAKTWQEGPNSSIPLPDSVKKRMQKEGASHLEIMSTQLSPGDTYQLWLPGGRYAPAKIIGPDPKDADFVLVEYMEAGAKVRSNKPIQYLAITPKQIKEAGLFYKKSGAASLEKVIEATEAAPNAKQLVQSFTNDALEAPGAKVIKEELTAIFREQGTRGVFTARYQELQKTLKEVEAPYIPLSKQEIDTVFEPLKVIGTKVKLGEGDKRLIEKARKILDSKKRFFKQDKQHRDLLEFVASGPERAKTNR